MVKSSAILIAGLDEMGWRTWTSGDGGLVPRSSFGGRAGGLRKAAPSSREMLRSGEHRVFLYQTSRIRWIFLILYSYLSRGSFFSRSARDDQHILYSGRRGVCGCAPFRLRSASMHCLHEEQSRLVSRIVAPRIRAPVRPKVHDRARPNP